MWKGKYIFISLHDCYFNSWIHTDTHRPLNAFNILSWYFVWFILLTSKGIYIDVYGVCTVMSSVISSKVQSKVDCINWISFIV